MCTTWALNSLIQRRPACRRNDQQKGRAGKAMATEQQSGASAASLKVEPAKGKLGVMVVGLGAVSTTMIAGVEAVRRGLAKPIGFVTLMGIVLLGKRTDNYSSLFKVVVTHADLNYFVVIALMM